MKKFKILALSLFLAAFAFNACEEITDPVDPEVPEPASSMMATSKSDKSVLVKWTASPSETSTEFDGYVLTVTGGAAMAPIALTAAQNPFEVTGLNEGTVYTFTLKAKFKSGEVSDPVDVIWSPAARFEFNENDAPIRIYETVSSLGSGLVIYNPQTKAPKSAKVSDGASWTLGLYTKNNEVAIGSPKLLDYNYGSQPGVVEIGNVFTNVSSLDAIYGSQALSGQTFSEKKIDLKQYSANIVLVLRYKMTGKTEWNYAKVLVKYQTGSFLAGAEGNKYVEMLISHQAVSGIPYAKIAEKIIDNTIR